MPEPKPYIVGRQTEVDHFASLLYGRTNYSMLNIFGPGGIGKTVVGQKMQAYAQEQGILLAFVDGIRPDLTSDRILYRIKEGMSTFEPVADSFSTFEKAYREYLIIQEVLERGGGLQSMFDTVGSIKDPSGFATVLGSLGKGITESIKHTLSNRFALERYLRGVDQTLTSYLKTGLQEAVAKSDQPLSILVDTYEELEGMDDWFCHTLAPALPKGVKVVILGRNALPKVNFDWREYGDALNTIELPELSEAEAKAYLVHYGLRDPAAQENVYQFTGGYPLLLVLVRHLAKEAGGWEQIGTLERHADRDYIATELLKRILREESVAEIRSFLEKGVVARWFDPETIGVIMQITPEEARSVYDQLRHHSFVERHPYGLKFHDKIRQLLVERLKFTSESEYQRITKRLREHYAEKAGIELEA